MTAPAQAQPPSFSIDEFRASLGMFATGVTIVTARAADGALVGLTANSFNSVSLDPPLVLWSLARSAASMAALSTGSHYAVNILAANQKSLAERFAAKVAATIQGSTETTFYVLAVYFGAVGIQRARHAVGCALLAELAGVVAAIAVGYWFFG